MVFTPSTVASQVSKYMGNAVTVSNMWGGIIINVKSSPFLAKGDGTTDDTIAIQAAIDYAISIGKSEITFPAGTYIYTTLTNSENITAIGDGVTLTGTTTLKLTSLSEQLAEFAQLIINVKSAPYNAVGDGVTNDYAAINAALDVLKAAGGGTLYFPLSSYSYLIETGLDDGGYPITFLGDTSNETFATTDKASVIKTSGAIVGIKISGNRSSIKNLVVLGDDGITDNTSHGIHVRSSRAHIENVVCWKNRGSGIMHSLGNCSYFSHISSISNKGHGIELDPTGEGSIDNNSCTFISIDVRANVKSGFKIGGGTFATHVYGITSQGNTRYGIEVAASDWNVFYGAYLEANTIDEILYDTGADNNRVYVDFTNATAPIYTDNSVNQRNYTFPYYWQAEEMDIGTINWGGRSTGTAGYITQKDDVTNHSFILNGTTGSQEVRFYSAGAGLLGIDPDYIKVETVIAPTLLNSWVNFGGTRKVAGYWKDKNRYVHLEGLIKDGTTVNPTAILTLPAGYRPSSRLYFPVSSNGAFGSVFIDSDGNVYFESGSATSLSLSGIYFRTT